MNDLEIIETVRKNNLKGGTIALKNIYKNNYYMVENYILKNSGTREDAKDIFQDSVIVFYKNVKMESFELSGKISTYIYSISRNIWLKKIRNNKMITSTIEDHKESFINSSNILIELEYSDVQVVIAKMLANAGEKCKNLLTSFYYDKLSMHKIAVSQGYSSEQIAKNQKVRCLKKIRKILSKSDHYTENLENSF